MRTGWELSPFPHLVVDDYLSGEEFNSLCQELDNTRGSNQATFNTALDKENLYMKSQCLGIDHIN